MGSSAALKTTLFRLQRVVRGRLYPDRSKTALEPRFGPLRFPAQPEMGHPQSQVSQFPSLQISANMPAGDDPQEEVFMKHRAFLGTLCLMLCLAVLAQEALTNDSIVKMVKAGLGDEIIVSTIQSQPGNYNVTPDALVALKGNGVSDKVLAAMEAKASGVRPATPAPDADFYADLDVGVYHKVKDVWTLVQSEPVNWKTGGLMKSIASQGIVKGDVNGRFKGPASATKMNTPLEFLIKTPDGVEATDFQLVHLHVKSDAREFRTATGGVFHSTGGSARDAVAFQQTRIAKRTFKVTLPEKLAAGEYAFLAPGLTASSASGSTGKAYTFQLVE